MASHQITTVEQLHCYLGLAMQLEHATIPPYLTALYSIHPSSNPDASHVIRTVAADEDRGSEPRPWGERWVRANPRARSARLRVLERISS